MSGVQLNKNQGILFVPIDKDLWNFGKGCKKVVSTVF